MYFANTIKQLDGTKSEREIGGLFSFSIVHFQGVLPFPHILTENYYNSAKAYSTLLTHQLNQEGRGHWALYYTSPQSLIIMFLIRWLNNLGDFH